MCKIKKIKNDILYFIEYSNIISINTTNWSDNKLLFEKLILDIYSLTSEDFDNMDKYNLFNRTLNNKRVIELKLEILNSFKNNNLNILVLLCINNYFKRIHDDLQ